MSDSLTDFLAGLAARGHEPLLAKTSGRVCLESSDGDGDEAWLVCIDDGRVDVVAGNVGADCTLRASRDTLERVAAGELNAMAAMLRGAITVEGDWELLVRFQRLFPIAADRDAAARVAASSVA
ncbi:MAG: SCP2 sterol-binding domain-containing protein [Gaiellaceae bacterium]|jgi:putative sterol carrier protein